MRGKSLRTKFRGLVEQRLSSLGARRIGWLALPLLLGLGASAHAQGYDMVTLGDPELGGNVPRINASGQVAWMESDGTNYQVRFFDGASTTSITSTPTIKGPLLGLNDLGQIVWSEVDGGTTDYDIYLFDGVNKVKLTDDTSVSQSFPDINNLGQVVWDTMYKDVFLYDPDTQSTTKLDTGSGNDTGPRINNLGHVVWYGYDGNDYEIYFYDGATTTALTNNTTSDYSPSISDSDQVVWYEGTQVYYYDGVDVTNLGAGEQPSINPAGTMVVWEGWTDSAYLDIYGWDGANVLQLTSTRAQDQQPSVNDDGDIVFMRVPPLFRHHTILGIRNDALAPSSEVCDGIDNDFDGEVDEFVSTTYYADLDSDGFGDARTSILICSGDTLPANYVTQAGDCDDTEATTHPGAEDVCGDGIDNNCNGTIDELGYFGAAVAPDQDGDGYGNPAGAVWVYTCADIPTGYVQDATDCDDSDAAINPGAVEICDLVDNDCDHAVDEGVQTTFYADADGDGFGNPGAPVNACDVSVGYVADATDCNDTRADANPAATEVCDGIDNDCDAAVDEDVKLSFYQDSDGDGFGNPALNAIACSAPVGYVDNDTDCNDANPTVHPGAIEVCNGIDDNCDAAIDEGVKSVFYEDGDSDGYGNTLVTAVACTAPAGYVFNGADCNDANATVYPGAIEVCDGFDNNCDGAIDEGVKSAFFEDADSDGFGNAMVGVHACTAPTGYVTDNTDCNDADAGVSPSATETCDNLDNDCDGVVDDGVRITYYVDADGDGFGDAAVSQSACSAPVGYVADDADCNDVDAAVHPGATEVCDGVDDDCDGAIDQGLSCDPSTGDPSTDSPPTGDTPTSDAGAPSKGGCAATGARPDSALFAGLMLVGVLVSRRRRRTGSRLAH